MGGHNSATFGLRALTLVACLAAITNLQTSCFAQHRGDEAARLGVDKLFGNFDLRGRFTALAITPDSQQIVTVGNSKLQFWDIQTGKRLDEMAISPGYFQRLVFSPDGTRLAGAGILDALAVWDIEARAEVFSREEGERLNMHQLVWSPDGTKLLSSGNDRKIRQFDAATGQELNKISRDAQLTVDFKAAYSTGGSFYAAGQADPYAIYIFDGQSSEQLRTLQIGEGRLAGMAFLSDDKLLTVASQPREVAEGRRYFGSIKVWDVTTGEVLREFERAGEMPNPRWMCVAPSLKLLAVKSDEVTRIYDVASGKVAREFDEKITAGEVHLSMDGKKLVSGPGVLLKVFDVETGARTVAKGHGHDDNLWDISVSPDSRLIASHGKDERVLLWDAGTSELLHAFECPGTPLLHHCTWSKDSRYLYAVGERARTGPGFVDGVAYCFDTRTRLQVFETPVYISAHCCALSPDGRELAVAANGYNAKSQRGKFPCLEFFDARTGRSRRRIDSLPVWAIRSMKYVQQDQLIVLGGPLETPLQLFDLAQESVIDAWAIQGINHGEYSVEKSRTNTIADSNVKVVDVQSGRTEKEIQFPDRILTAATITEDGKWMAVATSPADMVDGEKIWNSSAPQRIEIWDVAAGEIVQTIDGINIHIREPVFAPDRKMLYSGCYQGVVLGWKLNGLADAD